MNTKKGFTLVELLAVIVILAIIMIIAIPSVLQTLETALRKTFTEYITKAYVSSEKKYLSDMLVTSSSPDCVIYNIEKDLGISSTGEYKGYVLIKKIDGINNYYITLSDDNYMVYNIKYDNNVDNALLESFTYPEDDRLTKEYLAAANSCTNFIYIEDDGTIKETKPEIVTPTPDNSVNPYVVSVFKYDETYGSQDFCVTGDESTCKISNCFDSIASSSCPAGTVVKYKVNGYQTLGFNILHDDGAKVTMQYQKNNVSSVLWNSVEDVSNGPITALKVLEDATSNWVNVNRLTYTPGETVIYKSHYTACKYYTCNRNDYTMSERSAYARLFYSLEMADLGCTSTQKTCPKFVSNYLYKCDKYSDCPNPITDEGNEGYWSMNTYDGHTDNGIDIRAKGRFNDGTVIDESQGVRAVVEINKKA